MRNGRIIKKNNMNFWHISMHQPWGRNGGTIDSSLMLKESTPIIGTGEWEDSQCYFFKDSDTQGRGLKIGDVILVREGKKPLALCSVEGPNFQDEKLEEQYHHHNFRNVKILEWYKGIEPFPQPQGTLQRLINKNPSMSFVKNWHKRYLTNSIMNKSIELLKHKKQIILQGPPGTGKTFTAKQIAENLCKESLSSFSILDIPKNLHVNKQISSSSGRKKYLIKKVSDTHTEVQLESGTKYNIANNYILEAFDDICSGIKPKNKNGYDSYEIALAEYLHKKHQTELLTKPNIGEYKIIQFHPSYTYEDFVRGITAKSNNGQIEYITENKILADFAKKANDNFIASQRDIKELSLEQKTSDLVYEFADQVQQEIEGGEPYRISESVEIIDVESDAFRYKGVNWNNTSGQRMKFDDLIKIELNKAYTRQEVKSVQGISGLAIQHATYFNNVSKIFRDEFLKDKKTSSVPAIKQPVLKNYVLVIDEINRANLPAVLGELIYALEYRGKKVESMYDIDGDNSLVLPPNLYIIGTMNTADRSVGHIDYAIRRRFAFESILPNIDVIETEKGKTHFKNVADLFTEEFLSADFKNNSKDVQIGHSYFMGEESELSMKMKYEVVPILNEYLKDGIFNEEARKAIQKFELTINE